MIAATNYEQHRTGHGRAEKPVAALNRAHSSAARHKAQDRPRERAGILHDGLKGPPRGVFIVSSLNSPALRGRRLSRLGWVYRSAREFLEISALTRAGIKPDHAVALLSFQTADHSPCRDTDLPQCHSSTSSLSHEQTDRGRGFSRVRTSFQEARSVFGG